VSILFNKTVFIYFLLRKGVLSLASEKKLGEKKAEIFSPE